MHLLFLILILFCQCLAPAHAMSIDKLILVSKDKDSNFFKLTNNTPAPIFVTASITEDKIGKNGIEEVAYTADNIDQWKINLSESEFVLMPNESKIVYVNENECTDKKGCKRAIDDVFSISFMPTIYQPKDGKVPDSVGIIFGFSPSFILPATNQKIDYSYKIQKGKEHDYLLIDNTGNTMLTVLIDQCGQPGADPKDCSTYRQLYAGRTGKIPLPERYQKNNLKLKLLNGAETYVKDYIL